MGKTLVSRRFGAFSARTTIAILLALSCLCFRPTPAEAQDEKKYDTKYDNRFAGWTGSVFAGGNSTWYGFERRDESRTLTASPAFEGGGSIDYNWGLPYGFVASVGVAGVATRATASPDEGRRNVVIKGFSDAFYMQSKLSYEVVATPSATLRAYIGPLAGFARTYITERDDTKNYTPFIYGFVGGFTYTPSDQSIPLTYFVQTTYLTSSSYATDNVKLNSFGGQFGLTFPLGQTNPFLGGNVPPGGTSWSQGFHPWIGLVGGGGFGTGEYVEGGGGTGSFGRSGGSIGATLGYGGRIRNLKLGIEGDINWSNIDGSSTTNCAPGCGVKNDWYGTARGVVGYQLGNTPLVGYGTGGLAFGNVTAHVGGFPDVSETKTGWVAGGGVAFPTQIWAQPFVLKAEVLHFDLGEVHYGTAVVKSNSNIFRMGANYPF